MFMEVFIRKKLAKPNKNVTQIPICLAFYCAASPGEVHVMVAAVCTLKLRALRKAGAPPPPPPVSMREPKR